MRGGAKRGCVSPRERRERNMRSLGIACNPKRRIWSDRTCEATYGGTCSASAEGRRATEGVRENSRNESSTERPKERTHEGELSLRSSMGCRGFAMRSTKWSGTRKAGGPCRPKADFEVKPNFERTNAANGRLGSREPKSRYRWGRNRFQGKSKEKLAFSLGFT